ncbi:NosR/NirI family protein [Pelagibius marinus]|uniref:NosR/NirI family protein n=1 Tax=Pelagibius marinus TaxID=2762760 RepID=UPI001D04161C|nr:NosR/NirI family protein [Pelagibius marinus]
MRLFRAFLVACVALAAPAMIGAAPAAGDLLRADAPTQAEPDPALAARLFGSDETLRVVREEGGVPGWSVSSPDGPLGYIASTWEISHSVGYSGRPIDILVAVTEAGRIAGAQLVRHNEPILTLGISTADIARYIDSFAGIDLTRPPAEAGTGGVAAPDVIARATVSSGVIRDSILRTARTVALARSAAGGARIDRLRFAAKTWAELQALGALAHATVTLDQARAALGGAKVPIPSGKAPFIDLWAALLDPPTIGRNLLGQQAYSRAVATLGAEEVALFVASAGLHSHRGTAWRRSGVFERLRVVQDGATFEVRAENYLRLDRLAAEGAPDFKELSLFRLPTTSFDPTRPFTIEVTATRETERGEVAMRIPLDYALPGVFVQAAAALAEVEPLWIGAWQRKRFEVIGVGLMLTVLALILFLQQSFVRRPRLWRWGRIGFLSVTLVWLGWIAGGQLSVVHIIAFVQSLLTGFRWETFLIEPVVFMLWSFVALGLLFWGRGVFCGWLCPFGALQELTNEIAQRLSVPQVQVPQVVQERLWVIKYTLFVAILGLSFYSMEQALVLAEVEPFKTAMSMLFIRAWPFVLFVAVILVAGLFIERFYCRYLCPLGAALAIPAKLKLFDWLSRRPQCGRECRLCEKLCTVGAIDPIGRINPNECVLCLRCQMIYHDANSCTILKRRQARMNPGEPPSEPRPS